MKQLKLQTRELIHSAWYRLIVETCSKIHCEVAPSFPAGVSQVCIVENLRKKQNSKEILSAQNCLFIFALI